MHCIAYRFSRKHVIAGSEQLSTRRERARKDKIHMKMGIVNAKRVYCYSSVLTPKPTIPYLDLNLCRSYVT